MTDLMKQARLLDLLVRKALDMIDAKELGEPGQSPEEIADTLDRIAEQLAEIREYFP